MSKYDDVQQFKDKINLKDIDYKEFPKDDNASALQRWAIVDQVAGNGSVVSASKQPTPANTSDFSSAAPVGTEQPAQPSAVIKENTRLPGHVSHNFEHLAPPVPPKPARAPQPEIAPTLPVQGHHFNSPAAEVAAVSPGENKRFKQMFSKKASSADEMGATDRNTLLKPLLESIASCR
ncbi:cellulose biosynthesis protein BcsO [Serratia sp. L9]|uniref:cellulose biosynthesis protein BcsO n=1 Tax=Serratia sp. L9 TaxID=3423946 RepID=UPI003D6715D4